MRLNKAGKKARGNPGIVSAGIATRFKPGRSANPGGRPRRTPYADAHRAVAELLVADLRSSTADSVAMGIAKAVAREAMKGKIAAAVEAANRTEGRPREIGESDEQNPVEKQDAETTIRTIRKIYGLSDPHDPETQDNISKTTSAPKEPEK